MHRNWKGILKQIRTLTTRSSSPRTKPSRSAFRPRVEELEDRTLLNVQFTIDPLQDVQPISRYIYGINQTLAGYTNYPLQRLGGNSWTTYNWETNFNNGGKDWYFENYDYLPYNNGGNTTLSADIDNAATTLSVANAAAIVPSNAAIAANPGLYLIWIDNEQMQVTAVDTSANTLTVVRGIGGTTAASHAAGANLFLPGGAIISTLQNAAANDAAALITVPINGNVAADGNNNPTAPVTTITSAVSSTATVISVANAAVIPSVPYYIVVGSLTDGTGEEMEVTGVNLANNTLTVVRGISFINGSTPQVGTPVYLSLDVRNGGANYLQTRFVPEQPGTAADLTNSTDPNSGQTVYENQFVNWVKTNFPYGQTSSTTPIWFSLDNEPDLWSSTHNEIQLGGTTTLTADISSTATTIPVATANLIAASNAAIAANPGVYMIWINSEEMQVTAVDTTANTLTVVRGVGGTAAAPHTARDGNGNPTNVVGNPVTYAELIQDEIAYAEMIKAVEPSAMVLGGVDWGWPGYVNLQGAPDADGRDWLDYYLQQMNQASTAYGQRLLDDLDLHYYTATPTDPADTVQAPRSLWDPTYVENSYVEASVPGPIELLPRVQAQIAQFDPGTKLSISEYNYGGPEDISGAIAEADALGIFGVQGVYAASEWNLDGGPETDIAAAFNMYRDFDGNNGTFGDTSVMSTTNDAVDSSIYASIDSSNPNVMTLVAINKSTQAQTATMHFDHVQPGATAAIYQLFGTSTTPQYAGTVTITNPADFTYTMPGYSVTTIRIVSPGSPGSAPTVATAAQASPAVVANVSTNLSVLGADAGGEANLTYNWITTAAPAPVAFSLNGANAAQNTVATFSAAGNYSFLVTITNPGGYFDTSSVNVTVDQTATDITVSPFGPTTPLSGTQQFTATSSDQFGNAMITPPTYTWSASTGTITSAGVYTAPATAGNAMVTAAVGAAQGDTNVFVAQQNTITVSAATDAALRAAVTSANADAAAGTAATIDFDGSLAGDTITLRQGPLVIVAGTAAVTINGGGLIALDGGGNQVFRVNSGAQAILDGLMIQDGNTGGAGGGIDNAGTLIVNNCSFVGNTASAGGGGIDNTGALTLANTSFTENTAGADGGAINNEQAGTLTILSATLTGNSANNGGGIANAGTSIVMYTTFSANNAVNNSGGAIDNAGTLTLSDSAVNGNSASLAGGGIYSTGPMTVTGSTIDDNTASYIAGGINNQSMMTVANSTLAGNYSYLGGGIYNGNYYGGSGNLTLTNDTLTGNFAAYGAGGGIYMANGGYSNTGGSSLTLRNTLIAGNFASGNGNDPLSNNVYPNGPDVQVNSGTVTGSNNLIGDGQGLTGISNGDANHNHVGTPDAPINPLLAPAVAPVTVAQTVTSPIVAYNRAGMPLAANGGATATVALVEGSPAIAGGGAVTTVTGPLLSGADTIPVADAASIASTPGQFFIRIDGEEMLVTNVNLASNQLTVERGINGVTATLHSNDPVYLATDQRGDPRATPGDIGAYQSQAVSTSATAPAVTGVSPNLGLIAGGTEVTITGVNLAGVTAVHFGAQPATILTVSASQILAVSPAATASGTVDVTVSTASSTSAVSPADSFTYEMTPTITGISPATSLPGGGAGVVITGTNLSGATAVNFGLNPAAIFSDTINQIVVINPAGTSGIVAVTVTTPLGTSPQTPADQFTYGAGTTTIDVTTAVDTLIHSGISLRDAVAQADTDAALGVSDTIVFDPSVSGDTIALAQGAALMLSGQAATITIDGGGDITVSGANTSRVFQIEAGAQAVLAGLMLVDGNAGTGNGGAIDNAGALTLLDDTLSHNTASNGGAIQNTGTLTVMDSTLSANSAGAGGAINNVSGGLMTVSGSTLSGNTASYVGGAINNQATLTVTNSTLAGNNADLGGGINNGNQFGAGGVLTLSGDTISGNTVTDSGGGIYQEVGGYAPALSTLTVANTIIAQNTADNAGPDLDVSNGWLGGVDNLIGIGGSFTGISNKTNGNQVGTSASPLNPQLAALASNGGATQTMALQTGSPVIAKAGAVTTLAAPIGGAATTAIPVANAAAIASTPGQYFIEIGSEVMEVTSVNLVYNYLIVIRGISGAVASHPQNAPVYLDTDERGRARPSPADLGAFQTKTTPITVATVTSLSSAAGPTAGDTVVAIAGVNLAGASAVHFGTKAATILSVSDNLVLAVSPTAAAGTVDVTVTTPSRTSAASPADKFTYLGAPTVTALSPAAGLLGGGTGVVITGANLLDAGAVDFGANPGVIVIDSADEIVALSPASTSQPAAGVVQVTVATPLGVSATTTADRFTYVASSSTLTVTTASDALIHSGLSLRDAVEEANADAARGASDTIVFAASLNGATITLGTRPQDTLELSGAGAGTITINGGGHVTINGNNTARVFLIDSGVHAILSGLTIVNGNAGADVGGAIDNAGTLFLQSDNLSKNTAMNGGAIANTGTLTLMNSTLAQNTAVTAAGAIYNFSAATATVTGCTLTSNTASYIGGAIANQANLTVTNSTLFGNNAYLGGGISNGNQYDHGGVLTLAADTISGNTVTGNGGGVYMENGGTPSTLTLTNTIVARNTADQSGPDIDVSSGALGGANNFIGVGDGLSGISNNFDNNQVGTSANPIDPKLAPLTNNGGPTQTMALQGGSQAIAAGGYATALAVAVSSATAMTITVADASAIARTNPTAGAGYPITIDGETMLVTAVAGNTLTVVRGYHHSKAATHASLSAVFLAADQRGLITPTVLPDIGALQTPTHLRVTANPANDTTSAGQKDTFTATAFGVNPSVQWQVSANGGATWSNVAGGTRTVAVVNGIEITTTTLSAVAAAAMNGDSFRAFFSTTADKSYSLPALLTVNFIAITKNPLSQTVIAGGTATFTVAANSNPSATVAWQYSSDGGRTWVPLSDGGVYSGTTTITLTITGATPSYNGYDYKAVFNNAAGAAATKPATLTVYFLDYGISPSSQNIDAGQRVTFTATANANPAVAIQWQVSTAGGPWTNIPGATSSTLSFTVSPGLSGNQYRAAFKNIAVVSSAYTNPATLTVNPAMTISNVSLAQWPLGQAGYYGTLTIAGGAPLYTVKTFSGLPPGLTPSVAGNIVSFTGTPTHAGLYKGSITIVDGTGASVVKAVAITIN